MRRLLLLALPSLVLLAACGSSDKYATGESSPSADVEQTLIRMVHDWTDAVVKVDTGPIERILADDFLATLPDGRIMSKRQHIEDVVMGGYKASAISITNAEARVFGDAAVVTFGEMETSRTGKDDTSGRSLWTEVFVKRDGRWQIVAEHGTRLESPGTN